MVNRNSRKLRISIPIEDRQSRLHTFSKNIQTASNNHPPYRVSFEYIFLCVNEPWKSAEREAEKGKKEIKIARNNRLVSNSLRLPCRILAGSGFDAHLPISPIKYHLPLSPLPSRFQRFPSRAQERERERRFVAITSDLARFGGGYSVKTRPNFSSFFVFYLQEKNH